jgi:futalosine hydrolase
MAGLLVVVATERELCGQPGLVCGVGPVEAAAATARALAVDLPRAVLNVGLAGGRGLAPGTLVVGREAIYEDLAAAIPVVSRVAADPVLLASAQAALPHAPVVTIATSATVGRAGSDATVEAMEGFAVLRAAALAGVPAVEVRAISNELGEVDRSRWEIGNALAALAEALPLLRAALDDE